MRIAYLSPIYFSDVDLSYLQALNKYEDVYYFIPLGPSTKGAAINVNKILPTSDILPASSYKELNRLGNILNLDKTFIINNGGNSKFSTITLSFKILRKLKELKIDVLHLTEMPSWNYFPLYLIKNKIVLSVHDPFVHSCVTSKRYELRRKLAFRLLKNFIIFNKTQRDEFVKHYRLEKKQVFNSTLSTYTYLHMYKKTIEKKNQVLFFGQITSHKGLDYLLPAMNIVHRQNKEAKLVVAGRGNFHFDISPYQNIDYIDIRNRFIPDEELANLIQESSIVVCPYLDATQSGVIMSAYAFETPVIATNVGGLPEMVEHLKTGIIISARDTQSIADSILLLLKDASLQSQIAKNIYNKYIQGEMSWNNIAMDIRNNIYKKMLK